MKQEPGRQQPGISGLQAGEDVNIMVNPNGGTVTVSVKVTSGGTYQAVADGNLSGNITAVKMDVLKGPVNAIKFTAASATATIEISQ